MPSCCAQRQPGPFTMGMETIFEFGIVLVLKKCSVPEAGPLTRTVPTLRCTPGKG